MAAIRFPEVDEPLVSVVMVTHGNWPLVRRSLEALVERTDPVYELIVVDSASPDETPQRLASEVEGANVVLSEENLGFGGGSNLGAEQARGRYVCFLNSDAIVEPGWLEPLARGARARTRPPAPSSRCCSTRTERSRRPARSIDSVGWPLAFGRGESADTLAHRFRREIDYGSAACLLVRREEFADVGGFDPAYGIGYFEDVDLSFKLKERGLKTIYEPRSRVVHELHGSGTSQQAQKRMIANRALFYRRWSERLARRPKLVELPTNPARLVAARDAEVVDRILVLDDRVPFHDRGSGDPRMAKLLFELVDLWPDARVTLAAADGSEAERYAEPLLAAGIEVVAPPIDWERWFESRMYHYSVAIISRGSNVTRFGGPPASGHSRRRCARSTPRRSPSAGSSAWSASWRTRRMSVASAPRRTPCARSSWARCTSRASSSPCRTRRRSSSPRSRHDVPTFVLPHWIEPVRRSGRIPRSPRPALLRRLPRRRRVAERGRAPPPRERRAAASSGSATPSCGCTSSGPTRRPRSRRSRANGSTSSAMSRTRPSGSTRTRVHVSPMRFGSGSSSSSWTRSPPATRS